VDKNILIKKSETDKYFTFDEQDIVSLEKNTQASNGVDILLTNQWPKYVEQNAGPLVCTINV
jgi:hypothetical protein